MSLERTPQEQIVSSETPSFRAAGTRDPLAPFLNWLDKPQERYGRHLPAKDVPVEVLLEMLAMPVIALASSFLSAITVKAKYVIECEDEGKRQFFQEMYDAVHREFVLNALPALLLGHQGMVKVFELVPADRFAAWPSEARPLAVTGFKQIHPSDGTPSFERGRFAGIKLAGGTTIPPYYALWLTCGKHLVFGDYHGWGRLRNAYADWWTKNFARDLYLVYLQKNIQPTPIVDHPSGNAADGRPNREHAKTMAEKHMAGAPITMPSDVYSVKGDDGLERLTSVRKWALRYVESGGNVQDFHQIDDQHDAQMAMGLLIPSQALMKAQMTSLSGSSTTETLGELAEAILVLDIAQLDRHINDYVFPIIDRANFAPGGKPVRKRTVGLQRDDRANLWNVLMTLLSKAQGTTSVDTDALLDRLEVPRVRE